MFRKLNSVVEKRWLAEFKKMLMLTPDLYDKVIHHVDFRVFSSSYRNGSSQSSKVSILICDRDLLKINCNLSTLVKLCFTITELDGQLATRLEFIYQNVHTQINF